MSPDSPEEADFHGQALSPVSPKPLHFPKPSNIPLLEDQMDPAYNGTTDFATSSQKTVLHDGGKVPGDGGEAAKGASDGDTAQNDDDETSAHSTGTSQVLQNGHVTAESNGTPAFGLAGKPSFPSLTQFDPGETGVESDDVIPPHDASFAAGVASGVEAAGPSDTYPSGNVTTGQEMADPAANAYEPSTILARASNDPANGVNIQALLDNLSSSIVTAPAPDGTPSSLHYFSQSTEPASAVFDPSQANHSDQSPPLTATLPPGAGLPPRPPPQDNPTSNLPEPDLRSYHLHDHQQQQTNAQKYVPSPGTSLRPPGNLPPPIVTAGAPGTTPTSNNLPPPPVPTFQQTIPTISNQPQGTESATSANPYDTVDHPVDTIDVGEDTSQRWSQDVQRKYDAFLQDERMYVTRGEWHNFPANSRLFIGNLPTEKVTKRDLFHVFHKYGKLAQVSIKQAYGFIQYLEAADCLRALQTEQGTSVRGRKIHLEISKPQRGNQNSGKANRRSRSPDYTRSGAGGSGNQKGGDRYRGGEGRGRQSPRVRDDYRPGRSPSPRARGSRRSPNRRRRSRSRSPQARYRSPSPRRGMDDDCVLPRRAPQDVPDVQIIAKDDPDRVFVSYVEKAFEARGIKCNVLILSPRLSEASVVRRQIIEGVLGVVKLDRAVQMTQKFQLSIFDRSAGANNVKFEEYADINLNICVELVFRAKQNAVRMPQAPQYYGLPIAPTMPPQQSPTFPQLPQAPQQPQPPSQFPMDSASLQQLLGRAQQPTPQQQPNYGGQQQFHQPSDLSRLLASASGSSQNSPPPYQNFNLGGLDGLLGRQGPTPNQQHPQQQPPQQSSNQQKPDMANLMAMLGRYK